MFFLIRFVLFAWILEEIVNVLFIPLRSYDYDFLYPLSSGTDFTGLLGSVVKMGHYSTAISMFNQMVFLGVPVNKYTLNIAINYFCRLNRIDLGYAIWGAFYRLGLQPDVDTFTTILNVLILQYRVSDADSLFNKLIREKICIPDQVTYTTMINGLCKIGNTDSAIALLKLMVEHECCKPNVLTYNTIIDGLCKHNRIEVAEDMLQVMIQGGLDPNVITYNSLINIYCLQGETDKAMKILDHIMDKGLVPNNITYNSLLNGYSKHGQLEKAKQLFVKMEEHGCLPDSFTHNILLRRFIEKKEFNEAGVILEEMNRKGFSLDSSTFSMLTDVPPRIGKDSTLLDIVKSFGQLIKLIPAPNEVSAIIDGEAYYRS